MPEEHRLLRSCDRLDGQVQPASLLLDNLALESKHRRKIESLAIEKIPDLLQREADELQGHDLLQARQIPFGVQAISGARAPAGREKPKTVVIVKRSNGHSRARGKLTSLIQIRALHGSLPWSCRLRSDVTSGSSDFFN